MLFAEAPGEGAIFFNPTSDFKNINFIGEVTRGNLLLPIAAGFSIRSSQIPKPGRLHSDLGFPISEGDVIHLFDRDRQNYVIYQYDKKKWSSNPPVVNVGEAFWIGKTAPGDWVQYSYLKPFLAINPFFTEASLLKKIQTATLILRMKHPGADKIIGELVELSDFQTTYAVLEKAFEFLCHRELEEIFGLSRGYDRFAALLDRARGKHGELADLLLPVFEEEWRQTNIIERRAKIKGEDHRFFLALLLNVPERTTMLRLVKERFPEHNEVDLVVGWVRELSATKIFGSREPNVLGIGEFDDRHLFVFRALLEGLTTEEMRARAAAEPQRAPHLDASIDGLANHLKALPLFKPTFCS